MKTKTDISYGIIPLRQSDIGLEVLLIHQSSRINDNVYWTFPKGHVEGDETPQQTAVRELWEETGLKVQHFVSDNLFTNEYSYEWQGTRIEKTAAYFIALVQAGEVIAQEVEVHDTVWLPLDQVVDRLDYEATKQMWQEVKVFVDSATI